ncbi:MAG: tetratricopeptide repeat protein [Flavobacteriales bacterium]|nr:tetratricopeptide repeat protein [Flavobacteriales bacterium]
MHLLRTLALITAALLTFAINAQSGKAFLKEANKLLAQQQFEQAVEKFGFAIRTDPKLVKAYMGRADAYGSLGRMAERAADLAQVAQLMPADAPYAIAAAAAYADLDSTAKARTFADQAVRVAPKNQDAQMALARACLKAGDLDCATRASDQALAIKATTDTYYLHGVVRTATRDYKTAEFDLDKVIEWNHLYEPAYVAVSEVQLALYELYTGPTMKARTLEKAIEKCTRALELNPQSTDALFVRSKALAHQKEYAKAVDDVSRCIALGRTDRAVYLQRALYYKGFGQHQNAVNDLNRIVLTDAKDVHALLLRAECKEANVDLAGALKDIEAAQKAMEADGAISNEKRGELESARARITALIFEQNREADPPSITVVKPFRIGDVAKVSSSEGVVEVSGYVRDKSLIKSITVNGKAADFTKDEKDPMFVTTIALARDAKEIVVQAIDAYENFTSEVLAIERSEGVAPLIALTAPKSSAEREITIPAGKSDVFLEGTVTDASLIRLITVNGQSASYAPDRVNPDFSIKVELKDADRFTVRAEDQFGNAAEEQWSVKRAAEAVAVVKPVPSETSAPVASKGGTWVVHIENTNYRNFPAAQASDASKMQKAFASYQIQRTIGKKNLTKEQMERFFNVELRDLARTNKVSTILVWFSGHGRTAGGKAYWIPVDGKKDDIYSYYNYGALKAQMQNYSESVSNTVVVSDAAAGDASFFDLTR